MFRRVLLVSVFFLSLPGGVRASVIGTAHDTEAGGAGGACAACHVPHQAAGERFAWAQTPVYEGKVGTVAALCGSCHHSGEGYGAVMTRAHSDDYVYASGSHGQKMYLANPPPGTDVVASGLPDVDAAHGYFECTTCHNVHDDTFRPFLRDDPNALCARCHTLRHYVNGLERSGGAVEAGAWGIPSRSGAQNPGSHPVGQDVAGGRAAGPKLTIPRIFRVPFSPEPGQWSLGGHLTKGSEGGVSCLSCHAVHGTHADPDDVAAAGTPAPPGPAFLVVAQATSTIPGYSRLVPNGGGGTSALCEACHGVDNNPPFAPGGGGWADSSRNVNPSRQGLYSHPVDSYPSSVNGGVSVFPSAWPTGDPAIAGRNVSPVPICESCHAPHPAAALAAGRGDVRPGAGPGLLRTSIQSSGVEPLCSQCHVESVRNHHPINKTYDSGGVKYLQNAAGGPGDWLTCSTCHSGAHNWVQPSWGGLDPAWLPRDNGRSPVQAVDMYSPDLSKTCIDCHYFMDGDGASVSPTLGSKQTVIATADDEYSDFQAVDRSMGTHYIGLIHEDATNWRLAPLVDIFNTTKTWRAQSPDGRYNDGLAPAWARFGGEDRKGSRVLVCESCHELQPSRNAGFKHLLLAPHEDGQNGLDEYSGDSDGRDILCEACHGVPSGSHPMTGNPIIDKYTGKPRPFDTSAQGLLPEILGYATLDRATNAMSCDSCHQTHDANTSSYTFMLDAPASGPIGSHPGDPVGPGNVDASNPSELTTMGYLVGGDAKPGGYTTPTLADKGGVHTGLCRQCHTY